MRSPTTAQFKLATGFIWASESALKYLNTKTERDGQTGTEKKTRFTCLCMEIMEGWSPSFSNFQASARD